MDFATLRHYLSCPVRPSARDVMQDAVVFLFPGAILLLRFLLELRVNRRTRRTFADVTHAFSLASPPKWLGLMISQLWNLYRLALTQCYITLLQSYKFKNTNFIIGILFSIINLITNFINLSKFSVT